MAALGMETSSGDFEVIDVCFAGLPELYKSPSSGQQPNGKGKAKAENSSEEKTWVALVSGLSVGAQEAPADLKVQLLVEWLVGESGDVSVSTLDVSLRDRSSILTGLGPNARSQSVSADPRGKHFNKSCSGRRRQTTSES